MIEKTKDAHLTDMIYSLGMDEYWSTLDKSIQQMINNKNSSYCGILISGYAGTGKTFFAETFLKQFEKDHPVLIARHNQQHEGIPYFGFKYGISDHLSKIYNQFSRAKFHDFSSRLQNQVGDNFPLLLDYIPELSLLASKNSGFSPQSVPKVENQLYPLFKMLFEFLADYYKKPVLFFTDNLQWIDGSGINLLKYLLLNLAPEKLIWIGAYRVPHENVNNINQLNEALSFEKRYVEHISIKSLNPEQTKKFIELVLDGPCDSELIGVCYELTGGNPAHLQILLKSLQQSEDLLWKMNGSWQSNKKAIKEKYRGQLTQNILMERIGKLSKSAYEMLCITACMGRFSRRSLIDWLKGDEDLLNRLLKEAQNAGILQKGNDNVLFEEMYTGEMIYNSLSDSRKSELHYMISKLLYSRDLNNLRGTQIIFMTIHFNQSLDLVRKNGEIKLCAELNYKAGYFSKQDNAFERAKYFFKISADLLKECPWDEVKEQVWQVNMERARLEYYLREYDLAEIHLDFLLGRFHDINKRAKAFELKIIINNHLGRYRKVVQILKESLRELGLILPSDNVAVTRQVKKLKQLLAQHENKNVPALYDQRHDQNQQAILNLLYVGGMALHHTSDVLMTWAALQIISRSGVDTGSGVKAIGFVSYARMLIISGEIEKGVEFGKKGLEINKALRDINFRCRVFGVYAFYIQPWKKAFSDSMKLLEEGIKAGRETGDYIGLYILKTHQLNLHFISGHSLKKLLHYDFEESYPEMELTYYITHYQKSLVKFLMDDSPVFSIPRQQPSLLAGTLTIQEEKFYRNYVWARYYFLFGHYHLAERAAREANENRKLQEGSPLVPANFIIWFLSITQNWANFSDEKREESDARLNEILGSLESWKEHAPVNYDSSWWLLNAEKHKIKGEDENASFCYKRSLETSGTNIYHRALTNELQAKHLLSMPERINEAGAYLLQAIDGFKEWGALAKAKQLTQQYQSIISSAYPQAEEMDVETIQSELSGDMEVASLIKKLMVLLLRISGSTRVIIEIAEDSGELSFQGDLPLFYGYNRFREPELQQGRKKGIPGSMALMSYRSKNTLVVNDLTQENGIRGVQELQEKGVKSFLILPVTINGNLSMIIYLENIFAQDWYLQKRLKWIRITANQGAVIIENARTHERTVKLNEEIRKEMDEKERLSSVIEAQKDSHLKDLVQTQDNERKRIASDLHDSLGSLLSSVKLRFNGMQDDVDKKMPERITQYNNAVNLLDDAIEELRRIAHNMSPVSLKRFGLKPAIQTFIEQINTTEQLEAHLQILGLDRRLPEHIEIAAYRICQELAQNVIKHSRASQMRIQLIDHQDSLNIIVEDNGIGMEKGKIISGFGLNTIQSKVNLFKGNFTIESQPEKGTMVLVDIPV